MQLFLALVFWTLIPACSFLKSSEVPANPKLANLFNAYWEEQSKLFPFDATAQGDNRYNDLYPNDQSLEFRKTLETHYQEHLSQLEKFDRKSLNENEDRKSVV